MASSCGLASSQHCPGFRGASERTGRPLWPFRGSVWDHAASLLWAAVATGPATIRRTRTLHAVGRSGLLRETGARPGARSAQACAAMSLSRTSTLSPLRAGPQARSGRFPARTPGGTGGVRQGCVWPFCPKPCPLTSLLPVPLSPSCSPTLSRAATPRCCGLEEAALSHPPCPSPPTQERDL